MPRDGSASRRPWTGLFVVLLGVALSVSAGCMSAQDAQPAGQIDCGKCSSEVAALGEEIRAVPGVSEVKQIRYTERVALTTPASITVVVVSKDEPALRDAVAKAAWLSDVSPLEDLSVGVLAPGAKYAEYHDYALKRDAADFARRWGPRPLGDNS